MSIPSLLMCRAIFVSFFVFLHVLNMQAWTPPFTVAKENETSVSVRFQAPLFSEFVPIIRITNPDSEMGDIMYIEIPSLTVMSQTNFTNVITTSVDKDQRMVEIVFSGMKKEYAGTYECWEGNSKKMGNCGFRIIVLSKPDKPTIKMSRDSSPLIGQSITLLCLSKSNSLPSDHGLKPFYIWRDEDGRRISSSFRISVLQNGALVLSNLRRADKGKRFTCKAADDPGNNVKKLLSVTSEPFVISPFYSPNENDISINPYFVNNTVISKVEGTKLYFSCRVDCEPSCTVTWKRVPSGSNRYVTLPRNTKNYPSALSLGFVGRNMDGFYRCDGENEFGRISKGFTLDVQYISSPKVIANDIQGSNVKVFEKDNTEVQLTCLVDSNPEPTIKWKNPEERQMAQHRFSGPDLFRNKEGILQRLYTSNVTLKNLKCEDRGIYSCHAGNSLKTLRWGYIMINVRCQPSAVKIGQYPEMDENLLLKDVYTWDESGSVTGSFVVRGWPTPVVDKVRSHLNGRSRDESLVDDFTIIRQNELFEKTYLTLFQFRIKRDISLADRGRVYILTMVSSDVTRDVQFSIQPRGPPVPVSSLNVTKVTHDSITISWTPEFNGGETQTFSIFVRDEPINYSKLNKWTQILSNITDKDQRAEVKVDSLSSGKTYEMMIMACNSRGNTTSLIVVKTEEPPASSDDSLIIGIPIATIIVLIILGGVLCYFLKCKKRNGSVKGKDDESGKSSKSKNVYTNVPKENKVPTCYSEVYESSDNKHNPIYTNSNVTPLDGLGDYSFGTQLDDDPIYGNAESQGSWRPTLRQFDIQDNNAQPTDGPIYGNVQLQTTPPLPCDTQDGNTRPNLTTHLNLTTALMKELNRRKEKELDWNSKEEEEEDYYLNC